MEACMVYVAAAGEEEARRIAKTVVGERLAACANLLGPIRSFYWWEGELCEGAEAALVLKTAADRVPELVARIRGLHSYRCPGIACLPIGGGNPEFLDWIVAETRAPHPSAPQEL